MPVAVRETPRVQAKQPRKGSNLFLFWTGKIRRSTATAQRCGLLHIINAFFYYLALLKVFFFQNPSKVDSFAGKFSEK